ncbi:cellulase [Myxococcus stipitatus DSM 14675]|uniref:Cellulase n=1 Tax=Myxococcus stipitatus (strain DSM 14675 / JCM 12634 / Mx s8) TaxID=1278073 RepID=L7UEG9_MYXSD|nr:cellulase [Myxococcus stipitatus DSM 14675]
MTRPREASSTGSSPQSPWKVLALLLPAVLSGSCSSDSTGNGPQPETPPGRSCESAAALPVALDLKATTLPLEVIGPPGTRVEAHIMLEATDVQAAKSAGTAGLWLRVHNILAPGSAEVSLNDAPFVDLAEAAYGLVRPHDGDVAAGVLPVDPRALRAGDNRLVFRYTRQVEDIAGISGFRVLGAALVAGTARDGKRITLALPEEDPPGWRPTDSSAEAIERGRRAFQELSRDGGPACARCHADSGADLQYYAFSTHSLVQRARFHQFSQCEAEDLASYIRSLPLLPKGRAVAPPFQPGPGNHGAAGAGVDAVLAQDSDFARAAWGGDALPESLSWDWAAGVNTYQLPTSVALPTWHRWLPRELKDDWFTRLDGILARTEAELARNPTLESAQAFMSAALLVGKDVLLREGDYQGKVEVLRFAAVKLWDWSRRTGFDRADHGMPDLSPAYPYEVGFAFFEAAQAQALPGAERQTLAWWWAQLATYPGRGFSTGRRPLNSKDVLAAAEAAGLEPSQLAFLHLFGSWEESRGELMQRWGTSDGPVRLLLVPMRGIPASARVTLMQRFLKQETEFLAAGGTLDSSHHARLAEAWGFGCEALSVAQRAAVRALAPPEVHGDLLGCP